MISEAEAHALFTQVGFEPPDEMSTQDAFLLLMQIAQEQQAQEAAKRPSRGRTAVYPKEITTEAATAVLTKHGASCVPIAPCGMEVKGVDVAAVDGSIAPDLAGALEVLMALHGFVLLRKQGRACEESGVSGTFLTGEQQCKLSECFGAGALHSTHGVHPESPCRDVFRLSNDPDHGFNSVGPEWHNDGSFCREVFGHVIYHIIKAPQGAGDTRFAHLGAAFDKLPAAVAARLKRCASVNSNGGAVHPIAHTHPVSGRDSLYLHMGMTGAVLEVPTGMANVTDVTDAAAASSSGSGARGGTFPLCADDVPAGLPKPKAAAAARLGLNNVVAWRDSELEPFFCGFSELLDDPTVSYSHKWEEGDVVIIDNLAVAHKAAPGAHIPDVGLRILHRTTILSERPHDPPPALGLPHTLPTTSACPFESGATWCEGYVGYRWGAWNERAVPH